MHHSDDGNHTKNQLIDINFNNFNGNIINETINPNSPNSSMINSPKFLFQGLNIHSLFLRLYKDALI